MLLGEIPLPFLRVVALVFGLLWGSFLNVVIYRLPRGLSVVHPPSACPGCGKAIKPYDNIPVLSWLLLRGKARCCGIKISVRYPLVELMGGLLSLAIVEMFVRSMPYGMPWYRAFAVYLSYLALCLSVVAAAFIDFEHMEIPDSVTIGGTVLGVATATLRGVSLKESLTGAAIGFAMVWLPCIFLWKLLRGREGMGMGDAKLTMLGGAWFGWSTSFFMLMGASVQGTLAAIVVFIFVGKIKEPEAVKEQRRQLQEMAAAGDKEAAQILADDPLGEEPKDGFFQAAIPFGPFLILTLLELIFFGDRFARWYRELVGLA